jgi:AraC family transcriptional regulator
MTTVRESRRSSNGLGVAVLTTSAGVTRGDASPHVQLGVHLGRPVRATCRFDGRVHARLQSRGDIDLVPAGVSGTWEDDRATRVLRVTLSAPLLASAAEGLGLNAEPLALVPQYQLRDPQVEHIAWALEAELRTPASERVDWLYGESLGMALAARLVARYRAAAGMAAPPAPRHGLSRPQLARVKESIETNLDASLTLGELAAVAELGISHFKTLFKRSTGVAVHEYVMQRRVERARLLLAEGKALVEVAALTGFSDQSHLARWMRRLVGVTPRELRRQGS